jgi:hypothetical protein
VNTRRLAACLVLSLTVGACGLSTGGSPALTDRATNEQGSAGQEADFCVGREQALGWDRVPPVVRRLGDAWMAADEPTRLAVLEAIWADDGIYVNAFDEELVVGRQAVAEYMAFGMADNYLEITDWKPIYLHNNRVQIRWRDCCPDGTILLTGTEYGEIDSGGRFTRVTSFWDHSIADVASEACG